MYLLVNLYAEEVIFVHEDQDLDLELSNLMDDEGLNSLSDLAQHWSVIQAICGDFNKIHIEDEFKLVVERV